jgi:MFS family permease
MVLLVKEKKASVAAKSKISLEIRQFPTTYWKYLFVTFLFGIGNSSNMFLILDIRDKGLSQHNTIFVYAFYNLVAALVSYPAGSLSDKFGRKPLLLISFIVFLVTYLGFAFSSDIFLTGFLFVFYGLFQGIFRASGKSYAADFVPAHLRASGIGWYSTTVGLSGLIASIIAGGLWDKVSHTSVFVYGSALSLLGIIFLIALVPNNLKNVN